MARLSTAAYRRQPELMNPFLGGQIRMAERTRLLARVTLALAAFLGCLMMLAADDVAKGSTSAVIDVLPSQLNAQPPGANWLSYNGDFTGRRFSSLLS